MISMSDNLCTERRQHLRAKGVTNLDNGILNHLLGLSNRLKFLLLCMLN